MFKQIHRTEKNIRKLLQNGEYRDDFVQAAEFYRSVSYAVKQAEEIRNRIYPEIIKRADEIFKDQDRMYTRVIQIGNLIATVAKDSTTTSTNIDVDNILASLKEMLPQYEELIDQVYESNMQLARIQVNPSLYVLDKNESDPNVVKSFMESQYRKFNKNPSIVTLHESSRGFNYANIKSKGVDVMNQVIRKLTPFLERMRRAISSITRKSEQLISEFSIDQYIRQYGIINEAKKIDTTPVDEFPQVVAMKRMSTKAIATIGDGEYADELTDLIESYARIGDIMKEAQALRKQVSDEIKEEVEELFNEEERSMNSVIDLGEVIVGLTSKQSSRKGNDGTVMKAFIKELQSLIPECTSIIEDIYKANKTLTELPRKAGIRTRVTESTIQALSDWLGKIQSFVAKITSTLRGRNRKLRQRISGLGGKLPTLLESTYSCIVYPEIAIFGVGKDEKEAWKEAEKWADTTQEDWKSHMQLKKCNADVYDYVKTKGTPEEWKEDNGVVSLK